MCMVAVCPPLAMCPLMTIPQRTGCSSSQQAPFQAPRSSIVAVWSPAVAFDQLHAYAGTTQPGDCVCISGSKLQAGTAAWNSLLEMVMHHPVLHGHPWQTSLTRVRDPSLDSHRVCHVVLKPPWQEGT